MKLSDLYLNLGIKQKLLISYALIIIIMVFLISYINVRISTAYLISSARDHSTYLLNQVSKDLDVRMQQIIEDVFAKYTTSNLNKFEKQQDTADGQPPTPQLYVRYSKGLTEIAYSNPFIQYAIYVKTGQNDHFIVKKDIAIPDYDVLSNRVDDESKMIALRGRPLIRGGDGSTVYLMRALYDTTYIQYLGYLIVGIDKEYFSKAYADVDRAKVGSIVVRDKRGTVILHDTQLDLEIIRELRDGLPEPDGTTGVEIRHRNVRYLIQSETAWNRYVDVINIMPIDRISAMAATLRLWTLLTAIVAMVIAVMIVVIISSSISGNIRILLDSVRAISNGDFSQRIVPSCRDEVGQLAEEFNIMSSKVSDLMVRIIEEKRKKQQAEYMLLELRYKMLQARTNPHFLYNVLETINSRAILDGNSRVSYLVCMLAKMLRRSLRRKREVVSLKNEIDYIIDYLSIYSEIYGDRISIEYQLEPALNRAKVPCFILLPVVENAIVHGLETKVGKGTIRISSMLEDHQVVLEVADDGVGIPAAELGRMTNDRPRMRTQRNRKHAREGLRSVMERIRLLYGEGYGVQISSKAGLGTTVRIYLPHVSGAAGRPKPPKV